MSEIVKWILIIVFGYLFMGTSFFSYLIFFVVGWYGLEFLVYYYYSKKDKNQPPPNERH